jgi:hypothetical protein
MTYTAYRASQLEEGPLIADRIHDVVATSNAVPRVATYRYFTPTLVYYLGHTVTRLETPADIGTFFDQGGDALVLQRAVYEQERKRLPGNVTVLAEEQRFLRKHDRVVLIGRPTEVARGDAREQSR